MSRSWIVAASCAVVGSVLASNANAALVVVDFNDLAPGQLNGQAGGTGTSNTWAASTKPQVVAGDLVAPAATHYALAQSAGAAQSVRTTANSTNNDGQSTRTLPAAINGTVWFSFLVNPNDDNSRAGMSFNTSLGNASGARMDAVGTGLFVSYGNVTMSNTLTTNATHLLVGQVVVDAAGNNDRLRLWLDPDVNTLTEDTPTVFEGTNADWVGAGITSVAVQSYGASTSGGTVDAIRVSNNPTAQQDVTGVAPVPEPASLALCALGATALLGRRRRQQR
jgi:hypothetical protein